MYSPANFAPLSQASLKRLIKGHTVRVKHGSGLQLGLSKMQMKKHMASKKKGQGGYNLTMDPYQSQMHGEGFFDDVGSAFKKMGDSFVENVAKPVGREAVKEGKRQGRKIASKLIHEGIPMATEALGGLAGTTLGGLTGNPLGAEAGEVIGQQLGSYGGKKLAKYVGQKTGLGIPEEIAMHLMGYGKKRGRPRKGGTLLIDQPFTTRQAVNTTGNFFKNPSKTLGFGMREDLMNNHAVRAIQGRGLDGGRLLIDEPITARQIVNTTGSFIKNPSKTLGFGMREDLMNNHAVRAIQGRGHGGRLLIDEPITARQIVNTTGSFIKNPAKTLGFGMKKKMLGKALMQAGY